MGALLDSFAQKLTWVTCIHPGCGVEWAMTSGFVAQRRRDHSNFHCPNGHPQYYTGQSDEQKIKDLEATVERERQWRRDAEERTAQVRRSRDAHRAVATKRGQKLESIHKRIHAGVCPHCNRTFKQLAAHMKNKHAELVHEHESAQIEQLPE